MNKIKKVLITLIMASLMLNPMYVFAADYSGGGGGVSWGLAIIIALIVAGIACAIASGSMKSVHTATSAKRYEKEGSFTLTNRTDDHVNTTKQVIHHERNNN